MGEAHAIQRPMRSKAVGSAVTVGASTFSWASRSVTEVAVPWASRGLPSSSRVAASLPVRVRSAPFSSLTGPNCCSWSEGIIMAFTTSGR